MTIIVAAIVWYKLKYYLCQFSMLYKKFCVHYRPAQYVFVVLYLHNV